MIWRLGQSFWIGLVLVSILATHIGNSEWNLSFQYSNVIYNFSRQRTDWVEGIIGGGEERGRWGSQVSPSPSLGLTPGPIPSPWCPAVIALLRDQTSIRMLPFFPKIILFHHLLVILPGWGNILRKTRADGDHLSVWLISVNLKISVKLWLWYFSHF